MRQARLPLEILTTTFRHFAPHIAQRLCIEDSLGDRENFVVFNCDVAVVDGLKLAKVLTYKSQILRGDSQKMRTQSR